MTFKHRGANVRIFDWVRIVGSDRISIGSHVVIDDFVFIGQHDDLIIGNYVHIAHFASIAGGGRCHVADFAGISPGAKIFTGSDNFVGGGLTGPTVPAELRSVTRSHVVLESHVVVGANAVVLPGVTIHEGATVGAGSVVTRDLEPWTVNVGRPARPLRRRDRVSVLDAEQTLYRLHGRPAAFRLPPEPSA